MSTTNEPATPAAALFTVRWNGKSVGPVSQEKADQIARAAVEKHRGAMVVVEPVATKTPRGRTVREIGNDLEAIEARPLPRAERDALQAPLLREMGDARIRDNVRVKHTRELAAELARPIRAAKAVV